MHPRVHRVVEIARILNKTMAGSLDGTLDFLIRGSMFESAVAEIFLKTTKPSCTLCKRMYSVVEIVRVIANKTNKEWYDEVETGLNIIIAIVQKVYEWPSCPLAKMISQGVHQFGKRTVWSLLYFLNHGYYDISPVSNSSHQPLSIFVWKQKGC